MVRPGMSVFSKNTGPYRVISAPRYSSFHTVVAAFVSLIPTPRSARSQDLPPPPIMLFFFMRTFLNMYLIRTNLEFNNNVKRIIVENVVLD